MRKYLFSLVLILFTGNISYSQDEIDFEEFMGMMSETVNENMLDELSYQLPWNIVVTAYAHGDFSRDGAEDFAVAIRDKGNKSAKSVDVYFFENIGNKTYKLIKKINYKFYDVSIEVACIVKEGKCFVTYRDDNNWYFTGYVINDEQLIIEENEIFPIEFENAGDN